MKKLMIPMIALAVAATAPAQVKQSWNTKNSDPMNHYLARSITVAPDGTTYTLSSYASTLTRVTAFDGFGVKLWSSQLPYLGAEDFLIDCDESGAPVIALAGNGSVGMVAKLNRTTGAVQWQAPVDDALIFMDLECEVSGNVVLGFRDNTDGSPVVRKYSPAGAPIFQSTVNLPHAYLNNMAVAANGQIYMSVTDINDNNGLVAMTPNGTIRYITGWVNREPVSGNTPDSTVVCDRNGRVFTVELDALNQDKVQIRSFDAAGNPTVQTFPFYGTHGMAVRMDAESRIIVTSVQGTPYSNIGVQWFNTSASGVTELSTASITLPQYSYPTVNDVVCDAFGQTYVFGRLGSAQGTTAHVWAFDPGRLTYTWTHSDPNYLHVLSRINGAVGRWGQVSMVTTPASGSKMAESVTGIRQMGFRNLLINGSSHTGGRRITGTANFYSSDVVDRDVALLSNSQYAEVNLTTTVVAGESQSVFSVDLKPTAVRRAIRIEGTHFGATRSVVFYLEPPTIASLTLYPTTVQGGKKVSATARLNGDAPTTGTTITFNSNNLTATMPASLMIPDGDISRTFHVNTTPVTQSTSVTLSATTGSVTKTAVLTVTP